MSYHNRAIAVHDDGSVSMADLSGESIGTCNLLRVTSADLFINYPLPEWVGNGIRLRMGARASRAVGQGEVCTAWIDAERQSRSEGVDGYVPLYTWNTITGDVEFNGVMFGSWCAFGPYKGKRACLYVPRDHRGRVTIEDWDGTVLGETTVEPSSSGILRVTEDESIVMDFPDRNWRRVNSVQVFDYQQLSDGSVVGRVDRRWATPPVAFVERD